MADKVLIAKRDIYAEIDNGFGTKVRQLVAREGQEVPPALADHVDSEDVSSELPKTRSLAGRSASDRRALVDAEVEAPDHADVRAAAALPNLQDPADLPVAGGGDQELQKQLDKAAEDAAAEKAKLTAELEQQSKDAEERLAEAEKAADERVAEAEKKAEEAIAEAWAVAEKKGEEEPVKDEKGAEKARSKAGGDKARKAAPNKARKSAKRK